MELDRKHIKILKMAYRRTYKCDLNKNWDSVNFLHKNGLITFEVINEKRKPYFYISITEAGKAEVYSSSNTKIRANIALALSIIALIFSFLTAFTPFPDWSKELLSSIF